MKKLLFLALMLTTVAFSQVGIGITLPQATLDVVGKAADAAVADGFIAPRMTRAELTAKDAAYTAAQNGAIIYVTDVTGGDVSNSRAKVTQIGYYYFDGTNWQLSSGSDSWLKTGNSDTTPATNFIGTTDAQDFVVKTDNTERARVAATGSVGIGGAPNPLADLTLNSVNKGFVLNLVPLTSTTDNTTIGAHTTGMFVYNTSSLSDVLPGLYYNDGTKWNALSIGTYDPHWKLGSSFVTATLHFLGTTNAQPLALRTNNTERLRFDALQNVGIGTTTPANRLHIVSGGAGQSGLRTGLVNAQLIGTDANGDIVQVTLPIFAIGSIKYSFQSSDHRGWIMLDARLVNTFTATQQLQFSNLLSIGENAPIPDARDKYLSQVSAGFVGSVSGSNQITLVRNQLPNFTLTGTTGDNDVKHTHTGTMSGGDHNHSYARENLNAKGKNGGDDRMLDGLVLPAPSFNSDTGVHTHDFTTLQETEVHQHSITTTSPFNGTGVAPLAINIQPRTLKLNVFMYMGL